MKKAFHFTLLAVLASPLALSLACSSDPAKTTDGSSDSASCDVGTCPAVVTEDLTTPTVTFADVVEVFADSCADGGCHGTKMGSFESTAKAGLFLGADENDDLVADPTDYYDAIYASLMKASEFDSKLQRVKPGDWKNSFLMLKLDGCQDDGTADCSNKSSRVPDTDSECNTECGDGMPQVLSLPNAPLVSFPLDKDDLLKVRRWIQQGAPGPVTP